MNLGTTADQRAMRALLACLTLLAAFLFPLRMDALGSLNTLGNAPERTISGPELLRRALTDPRTCGRPGESHQRTKGGHVHAGHRSSAPGSGESGHTGHGAHCPFCLTNAFALEAGPVGLPQGPPFELPDALKLRAQAGFLPISAADARAPPVL